MTVASASLVSLCRVNALQFHLKKAVSDGVTHDELIDAITHLALFSG
ncbi:carboxymuconolactone decarboxylase family protein [Burkholderia ubonensis]|nr:carboxymuconolactone decarboxylase family protein [Burkholderia ubonensis]